MRYMGIELFVMTPAIFVLLRIYLGRAERTIAHLGQPGRGRGDKNIRLEGEIFGMPNPEGV